jgi:hypothetical protein
VIAATVVVPAAHGAGATERDFTMRIDAGNAVMQPVPGLPGTTEVLLRGVAPTATVTYVARPRRQYRIPIDHAVRCWTAYGDVTGHFRDDPPVGAIRWTRDGAAAPTAVALRGGRWEGRSTIRFRVGAPMRTPAPRPAAREHGWMTCNGVYSSQLLACSTPDGPPASWRIPTRTYTYCELPTALNAGSPIFIYSVVGIVSNANSFGPGSIAAPGWSASPRATASRR